MPPILRILKWFFFGFVYVSLLPTCIMPLFIIASMVFAFWAYTQDQEREKKPTDDFSGNNLLYRYGYEVRNETIPIIGQDNWQETEAIALADEMRVKLAQVIQDRFNANSKVDNQFAIKDRKLPQDRRSFLRILFQSQRGSQVAHFINFTIAGKYLIIHFISRIRGTKQWHDVFDFVFTAPATVWFWAFEWFNNNYSIVSALSRTIDNSYDYLDIQAFFVSSSSALFDDIRSFLKEKGLLTEELATIIQNNITNTTNVDINNSSGVTLGGITTAIQGLVPSAKRT